MQSRVEELEKAKEELKQKTKKLSEVLIFIRKQLKKVDSNSDEIQGNIGDKKKNVEIHNLKNELDNLKTIIKSYEERNINISDLEKKIRIKQANFDKEIDLYKEVTLSIKEENQIA